MSHPIFIHGVGKLKLILECASRIAYSPLDDRMLHDSPSNPTPEEMPKVRSLDRLTLDPPLINPWRHLKIVRRLDRVEPFDHAAPLSPLRHRDLEIMARWFDRLDMLEIEQEINHQLSLLHPEPPWEEDLDLNFL
ncbi:hypothetical protein [Leptolyngbya sp. FACHB-17]|uniref:hypothetical protein n=1 Tax=unclassified Leptolyngbya TaxID=2650499 RepID=UPI0016813046|nr:hypothetical protein [Leptolyngbya sp. FACHB-17]MBD2081473.1 hypothetical protein [Leptolyngbya sp. FACHB-17]